MHFFNSYILDHELPPGNKNEHVNEQDYNDNYETVVQISDDSNNKMGGQQETVINVKEQQQIMTQQRDTDQQQQQQQQQEEYHYQIQNPEDAQVPVVAEAPRARTLNRNPFQRSRYKSNDLVEKNNNQNQDSYNHNQQNGFPKDINHNNNYVSDDNNNNNIVQNIQKQRVTETKPAMVQPAREFNIPSFTVVTALFDLGRGQWKNFRRPLELYLNYSRQLLALEIPIVAYVQPEIEDRIWEMRRGKEHLTDVVVSVGYFANNPLASI